ncbi:hypothetical protein BC938DRAFT_484170 [Jimgerdemannia flammicorona]|uniref:Uncharacterized protein n=1 Tax=Jimgerdemannia flammicorona TaxID=994334 RepID=A0A433QAG0_9FUNG|nr:hypothetical protein BC938DRAFT_484170 [Jimgerdemannia flammicorona]
MGLKWQFLTIPTQPGIPCFADDQTLYRAIPVSETAGAKPKYDITLASTATYTIANTPNLFSFFPDRTLAHYSPTNHDRRRRLRFDPGHHPPPTWRIIHAIYIIIKYHHERDSSNHIRRATGAAGAGTAAGVHVSPLDDPIGALRGEIVAEREEVVIIEPNATKETVTD